MNVFARRTAIAGIALAGLAAVLTPAAASAAEAVPASVPAPESMSAPGQSDGVWEYIGRDVFTGAAQDTKNQGVTTDGTHWYFSGTNGLEVTDLHYNTIARSAPAIPPVLADPSPLAAKGLNHIGDIDYARGNLYISLDSSKRDPGTGNQYDTPVFAVYNAAGLGFTGQAAALKPPHGVQDIASWVAVDADRGLAYGMAYDHATELAVYNLRDWSFNHYVPLSQPIDQAQGGKIHDGWMYFASDEDAKTISRANLTTGQVQILFHLKVPYDQEIEGLSFLATPAGLTLNILNREQPDPAGPGNVTFYHYRLTDIPGTPAITGSSKVGGFVTADPGTWTPKARFTYQWLVNGKPLSGATGQRFHLIGKYLGDTVSVQVTGTWPDGRWSTVESQPLTVVTGHGAKG